MANANKDQAMSTLWTRVKVSGDEDQGAALSVSDDVHERLGRAKFAVVKREKGRRSSSRTEMRKLKVVVEKEEVNSKETCFLVLPVWRLPRLTFLRARMKGRLSEDARRHLEEALEVEDHLLACSEGQRMVVRGDSGAATVAVDLTVEEAEPFSAGLWTDRTEVVVHFEEGKSSVRNPSFSSSLLKFCLGLSSTRLSRHLAESAMTNREFPFSVGELCADAARSACQPGEEEEGDEDESTAIFINGVGDMQNEEVGKFCWLQSSGKSLLLQCCSLEEVLPEEPALLASPPLLQFLGEFFGGEALTELRVAPLAKGEDEVDIPVALEAKIAFLSSPAYDDLTSCEVERILSGFFKGRRYLLEDQVVEVSLRKLAYSLSWDAMSRGSVFFKVLSLEAPGRPAGDGKVGALVSSRETRLYQKAKLKKPLPPRTRMAAVRSGSSAMAQVSVAPPLLSRLAGDILEKASSGLPAGAAPASFLVSGPAPGSGAGAPLLRLLESLTGRAALESDCCSLVADLSGGTEARLRQWAARAAEARPCIAALADVGRLARNRNGKIDYRVLDKLKTEIASLKVLGTCSPSNTSRLSEVLVVGFCDDLSSVDAELAAAFDAHVEGAHPGDDDRIGILKWACRKEGLSLSRNVDLRDLSQRCSGFLLADLLFFVDQARLAAAHRTRQDREELVALLDAEVLHAKVSREDFMDALKRVHAAMADEAGAPKIPQVKWEDVGGLEKAKREILDTIQLPLQHPELLVGGGKRSGILMYGPPGVGKTLLAKAVATECSLNFLSVKGPELLNMYVGQSEENVRAVFERACAAEPCVVFFDELDSLAPNRGRSGDSGGVMDRVVSQLLAELDEVAESDKRVFVIGATNRPDLLDPSLLRPGRFDRLVYLGVPDDKEERRRIVRSLTRRFHLSPSLTAERVADVLIPEELGPRLTGADLAAICSGAALRAIARRISELEKEGNGELDDEEEEEDELEIGEVDFLEALEGFLPSVSAEDLQYYESVKESIVK